MIHVEEHNNFFNLPVNEKEWNELVSSSEGSTIFQSFEWLSCYNQIYVKDNSAILLFAYKNGILIGIAPLQKMRIPHFKLIVQKKIVFLGEVFSDYCDFILKSEYAPEIISSFFEYLQNNYPEYNRIDLRDVPHDSLSGKIIKKSDFDLHVMQGEKYLFINTNEQKDNYYGKFSRRSQSKIHQKEERLSVMNPVFSFSNKIDTVTFKKLAQFNSERIKDKSGVSFFNYQVNYNFLSMLTDELNTGRNLLVCSMEIDNDLISIFLCFIHQKVLYFFISGFDNKYINYSPGSVHLKKIIDYCFENDIKEFDFLRGDDNYKFRFHPEVKRLDRYIIFNKKSIFNLQRLHYKIISFLRLFR